MSGPFRVAAGTEVRQGVPLRFAFDGRAMTGLQGDTLASALLANGVKLIGRSFKYHRPRGIFSVGVEESNALVELGQGALLEPNQRATMVELYEGLSAASQNRWPSLRVDLMQVNDVFSRLLPAGFYYKTFMWPPRAWMLYEHRIRQAAGRGRASRLPDPERYEKTNTHCDVLVVGAGPAGLSAALAAAERGKRVLLVDEHAASGGRLRFERELIDGQPAKDWVAQMVQRLEARPGVRRLPRTTVFGWYDSMTFGAVERVADHLSPASRASLPRQRLHHIHAKELVLATGAIEQPITFANNDRPGVMLAGAVRGYLHAFGVSAGRRATIFATDDSAYRSAFDLHDVGVPVAAVIDPRATITDDLRQELGRRGIEALSGHAVVQAHGTLALQAVSAARVDGAGQVNGEVRRIECDVLGVGGGWMPSLHLTSHRGARPRYDASLKCFLPDGLPSNATVVGAARGLASTAACIADGEGGLSAPRVQPTPATHGTWWLRDASRGKRFVDLDDDVTLDDIELAHREGYVSVEHLKRYTTLGMGTDQGKTSNLTALSVLAALRTVPMERVGTTTFRPPYSPVSLGVFAGHETGHRYEPIRRTAMHAWHEQHGAIFTEVGLWLRPRAYPRPGETVDAAYRREAAHVRAHAGLVDVSTLGKIDIQGPDAAELLERVYINRWRSLQVGKVRYGVMLREDGIVFDDGTTARLDEHHYVMTTTTANAAKVLAHLEFALQVLWPELKVHVASVTEQWAAMALAGPRARDVLARCVFGQDVSDAALPAQGYRLLDLAGVPARVFRISYSGELAFEINVGADYAEHVWRSLLKDGAEFGVQAYGTEAMGALRIEKGHVAGPELDGRTTADDLGLGRMMKADGDFIGKALARRPGLLDAQRPKLVGLMSEDATVPVPSGAQLVPDGLSLGQGGSEGHVTSTTWSPALGRYIALGMLRGGQKRIDNKDVIVAADPLRNRSVRCKVVPSVFFDSAGGRMRG
jgi:methylglutamate dehydrogenase subunit C